jgi:GT2 family glycosyltransferase
MDVSVIIVNYNVKHFLEQALYSVQKASKNLQVEIIVVDNDSSDGSAQWVKEHFPDIEIIPNKENVGYARANNQAMKIASGRYFLILNPDTILQEDTIDTLVRFLDENSDVGAVGPKIIFPNGVFDYTCRRGFPTPWVSFSKLSGLSRLFPKSAFFSKYNLTYVDPDVALDVDALMGACMMISREAYRVVGGFDEEYFMYGEDIDWCYRISKAGWRVHYHPATQIIHYKGESTKRSSVKRNKHFYGAMHLFVRRHFHYKLEWLFHPVLDIAIFLRSLIAGIGRMASSLAPPIVDLALIVIAMMISRYLRFQEWRLFGGSLIITMIYGAIWLSTFAYLGIYGSHKHDMPRIVGATFLGFVLNSTFTYFVNIFAYSRLVVLMSSMMMASVLPGWRWALMHASRTKLGEAFRKRRTIVVGLGSLGSTIVEKLRSVPNTPYEVIGMVAYGDEEWRPGDQSPPVLGHVNDLDLILGETHPEDVIFSTESIPYEEIFKTISSLSHRHVSFKVVPGDLMRQSNGHIPLLDLEYRPKRGWRRSVRRAVKVIFS